MLRVLFVCTGNTCRSPMAETLLREKARREGKAAVIITASAGLAAGGGFSASAGAGAAMRRRGLDLSAHTARPFARELADAHDLILTMTSAHKQMLMARYPEAAAKVYTLSEFAGEAGDVSDPYGGDDRVYEASARQLEFLVNKMWHKIVDMAGN